jgi:hypothetical protein
MSLIKQTSPEALFKFGKQSIQQGMQKLYRL